jgi:hypothetical protein
MRSITVWSSLAGATANAYATNCPILVGLADQGNGYYTVMSGLNENVLIRT